jgi:hypothetical protein
MGWRYPRRKKLMPGVTLSVGKRGPSGVRVGRRGVGVSLGRRGMQGTISLLGTGLSYVWRKPRK